MGANNHVTTVPQENKAEPQYDSGKAHDRYMANLRFEMVRRGVIPSRVE